MKLTLQKDGRTFSFQTEKGRDISISLNPNGPRAWYVDPMRIEPVRTEQFLGSVAEGGAVNFRDVYFNPHGHGTHTENVGHIVDTDFPVVKSIGSSHYMAKLISVELRRKDASQGVSQGASQDLPQDLSQNLETGASQDLPQDLSQNLETGASQDLPQDLSQNLETGASQDLPQDLSQNLETGASQDLPQDLSQNLETGASQDLPQDLSQNLETGASQDLPQDLSQNLETGASQDLPQDLSQNLETGASQDLPQDLSQNLETGASQGDWVVSEESLEGFDLNVEALIIRTKPNDHSKCTRQYSGTNFPYLTIGAMQRIVDAGVQHLLIDLPSVDREEDGGALAAHHLFWNVPAEPNFQKTITELIYVPNEISDGNYILNLQVSNFANDAAPSRPMLFELVEE